MRKAMAFALCFLIVFCSLVSIAPAAERDAALEKQVSDLGKRLDNLEAELETARRTALGSFSTAQANLSRWFSVLGFISFILVGFIFVIILLGFFTFWGMRRDLRLAMEDMRYQQAHSKELIGHQVRDLADDLIYRIQNEGEKALSAISSSRRDEER